MLYKIPHFILILYPDPVNLVNPVCLFHVDFVCP